jgi:hypothetical protein
MEAIGDQLAEYGGSTAVLPRVGSPAVRAAAGMFDAGSRPGPGDRLRVVPAFTGADETESGHDGPQGAAALSASVAGAAGEPLGLARIGALLAGAAAAAPAALFGADYVEAAQYAGEVEELSRTVEYLQILSAGAVDRTRTQAIAAADAARARRSRTGTGWVTGWDNGVETLNETDAAWPEASTTTNTPVNGPAVTGPAGTGSAVTGSAVSDADGTAAGAGTGAQNATGNAARVITSPADDGCANTAEFLRQRLRIGKAEARRRLALAADVLPATTLTGEPIPPARAHLGAALTPTPATTTHNAGDATATAHAPASPPVSSRAGTIISLTLDRLRHLTTPETLTRIEQHLTTTAATTDPDFLTRVARRWADTIDADGTEPSEEALRHTQGAFIRKPRHGLHHLEIFATTDQYEHLLTVMNTATNPRTTPTNGTTSTGTTSTGTEVTPGTDTNTAAKHGGQHALKDTGTCTTGQDNARDTNLPDLDRRTRAQKQLDGLVGAAKTALATNTLPTTGGNRPQIIATINHQDLLPHPTSTSTKRGTGAGTTTGTTTKTGTMTGTGPGTGNFVFTGPVAATTLRKIACDADIIPALLGTHGEILDLGRKTRLFTPAQRLALTARDQGCTFPNCTIPAPWCEAHHITYWSHGGPTNLNNGALLCSHHHHLIHKEQWTITTINNTPWYTPPKHLDPHQQPQQNTYFKPPPPPLQ